MTTWRDVQAAAPEFAQRVQSLFDAHKHKTIATLRADGSPRISGIETAFTDGELTFGSMPNARKGSDLHRDPRFALHTATVDPVEGNEAEWPGEAKIAGRAVHSGSIPDGPTATSSAPTSPRSCSPTSTTPPHCSSSSGGHPPTA
ncbi:pyridoxamine 5'-phosphate oxidase family protein [Mycobacterium sp. ENV421]|uniref:pyridoxamine 5'-phosphate oxidase family protein n=1 Tax=Mycobacterium sp. ENV421 TaxID=1213407 RepID=UPI0018EA3B9B|nr:pyridoxamine 5'-phosphate oxidase family protein [Mycobacterium sp. ENV421]